MNNGYTVRYSMIVVLLCLICSCCQAASTHHYIVKCLDYASLEEEWAGLGKVKVIAVDTRSGAEYRVDEPFRDKITMVWCYEWDTLPPGVYSSDIVHADLLASPKVRDLVMATGGDGKSETVAHAVCCLPGTDLKGLECHAAIPPKNGGLYPKPIAHFYCIGNEDGGGLVYVDGEPIVDHRTQDGRWPPYYKPFFDHDGRYFYYIMHGLAKRFNTKTHEIDTIPGGGTPVIPWNQQALIVYSRDEKKAKLLDDEFKVKAAIDWKFDGSFHTVYEVDPTIFLVGVRYNYSAPGSLGFDSYDVTAIYELDFDRKSARRLVDKAHVAGQILSAERIE